MFLSILEVEKHFKLKMEECSVAMERTGMQFSLFDLYGNSQTVKGVFYCRNKLSTLTYRMEDPGWALISSLLSYNEKIINKNRYF